MTFSCAWSDGTQGCSDTVGASDVGHSVSVTVTASNDAGSASATSASVGPVVTGQQQGQSSGCSPAAGGTMTNTVSHLCGFADTTNTGVPAGVVLTSVPGSATSGPGWTYNSQYNEIQVNSGGSVNAVQCTCTVDFLASGGTLENSNIALSGGVGSWGVIMRHASNTTIVNNTIHGVGSSGTSACDNGIRDIYGDSNNLIIENNNIYWCSNPLNNIVLGGLIENNYTHDLATISGNHYEDLQLEDPGNTLMTIQDNTFFNQHTDQTASIILSNDEGGTENNRLINHNLIAGGGYCFYGSGGPAAGATNITFTNNHFSRIFSQTCGGYGPDTYWKTGGGDVWSGNVWDDTGTPLQP
jgi:hypothetical protein